MRGREGGNERQRGIETWRNGGERHVGRRERRLGAIGHAYHRPPIGMGARAKCRQIAKRSSFHRMAWRRKEAEIREQRHRVMAGIRNLSVRRRRRQNRTRNKRLCLRGHQVPPYRRVAPSAA